MEEEKVAWRIMGDASKIKVTLEIGNSVTMLAKVFLDHKIALGGL